MNKIKKLRICDWSLLALTVLMLASSIQLEGWWLGIPFIWIHIALGISFFALMGWHLQLHFNRNNWFVRLKQQKSHVTKWLAAFSVLTLITGFIATIHMFITWHHSGIGGWHGKIGFVFIAIAIGHIVKRIKFYKR